MKCLTHEAARILNVTPNRVRQMATRGELSAEVTSSGVRLFDREEVEQLAQRRALDSKARTAAKPIETLG